MRLPTEYSDMAAALTRYDAHHAIPHRLGRSKRPDRPFLFFAYPVTVRPIKQPAFLCLRVGIVATHSLTEKVKKKEKGLLDCPPPIRPPGARFPFISTYLAISQPGNQTSMIHDEDEDDDDCSELIH